MNRPLILVVDEDEAVLALLRVRLGKRYRVRTTSEPRAALDMARREQPNLIVCDLDMPGFDGGDVSAALFGDDATRDIPVLFLSDLVEGERQLGGRPAISKGAPIDDLIARIESLVRP